MLKSVFFMKISRHVSKGGHFPLTMLIPLNRELQGKFKNNQLHWKMVDLKSTLCYNICGWRINAMKKIIVKDKEISISGIEDNDYIS